MSKPDELTDAEAAHLYRLQQAETLLALFKATNRRPARTVKELARWAETPRGRAILARYHDENGHIIPLKKP